jgi:NAD(P)-dependent dehydrogenase (short-subunit alcohol dehydrogenase family)
MRNNRFEDRVVVITGSSGQIGSACVAAFLDEGARVGAVDLADGTLDHPRLACKRADLRHQSEIERSFSALESELGPIDVLVQSAAIVRRVPFLKITQANIDEIFAVNVRAVLLGARIAATSMIAREARETCIVNLTSSSAVVSEASSIAYEASKAAVSMATKGLATALAQHGIRVNAVGPGSMAKAQEEEERDPYDLDDYERRRIPLGRLGMGRDIAEAVLFLASPAAAYVTGTVLWVDGGNLGSW